MVGWLAEEGTYQPSVRYQAAPPAAAVDAAAYEVRKE